MTSDLFMTGRIFILLLAECGRPRLQQATDF
jgi:hypothetical protein